MASCSTDTVVYKVLGAPAALGRYYPDLHDGRAKTAAVFGHNRYSTNTWPSFKRVQPFGILGHNGEINTIARLRQEATMLGVPITDDGSDSQDLNRTVESLINREGLSLVEAMELVLPPIVNEIKGLPAELRGFYMYLRQAFGPFAQGPVALLSRHGDECIFSADALGLRPLWHLETADSHVFSSEPGVAPVADTVGEPKPLAPGEKVLVQIDRKKGEARLRDHHELQASAPAAGARAPEWTSDGTFAGAILTGGPTTGAEIPGYTSAGPSEPIKVEDRVLGGFGWQREDMKLVQQMATTGAEPIGSLGYDGPLACLSPERQNLADYFKESVAVVTNPAIDREREVEHFSCRAVFGSRPGIHGVPEEAAHGRDRVPGAARRPRRPGPALRPELPRGRARAQDVPARGPVGGLPRPRARCSTSPASSRRPPRARSSGSSRRPPPPCATAASCSSSPTAPSTRATAATSTRTWRWPPSTWRCASTSCKRGETNLRRRCGDRPALGGHPQRP